MKKHVHLTINDECRLYRRRDDQSETRVVGCPNFGSVFFIWLEGVPEGSKEIRNGVRAGGGKASEKCVLTNVPSV